MDAKNSEVHMAPVCIWVFRSHKPETCIRKITRVSVSLCVYACEGDVHIHSFMAIIHKRAQKLSTRVDR